jgi:hypothetical protein
VANYKKRRKPDYYKEGMEIPCSCFLYCNSSNIFTDIMEIHKKFQSYDDEDAIGYWAIQSKYNLLNFNMNYVLALKSNCPQIKPYYFTHHINAGKDMILDLT